MGSLAIVACWFIIMNLLNWVRNWCVFTLSLLNLSGGMPSILRYFSWVGESLQRLSTLKGSSPIPLGHHPHVVWDDHWGGSYSASSGSSDGVGTRGGEGVGIPEFFSASMSIPFMGQWFTSKEGHATWIAIQVFACFSISNHTL
jgi:hypothetical protein